LLQAERSRLDAINDKVEIPPKAYRDEKRKEVVLMIKKLKRG
jgi:hypothetical protein